VRRQPRRRILPALTRAAGPVLHFRTLGALRDSEGLVDERTEGNIISSINGVSPNVVSVPSPSSSLSPVTSSPSFETSPVPSPPSNASQRAMSAIADAASIGVEIPDDEYESLTDMERAARNALGLNEKDALSGDFSAAFSMPASPLPFTLPELTRSQKEQLERGERVQEQVRAGAKGWSERLERSDSIILATTASNIFLSRFASLALALALAPPLAHHRVT